MTAEVKPVCGIVMPISTIDGMDESHWADVLGIISDAVDDAGFSANLVSNSEDVGVIQKRIVQNLYENEIVVCDVSGKNPNVMFELGMRLAFDKPTIIIKDDATSYSFDTSPIEHLNYPRDLRFSKIVDFKKKLSSKIVSTLRVSKEREDYSPFLKHFGDFKVAKIDTKEVSGQEFILEEIKSLKETVLIALKNSRPSRATKPRDDGFDVTVAFRNLDELKVRKLHSILDENSSVKNIRIDSPEPGSWVFKIAMGSSSFTDRRRALEQAVSFISLNDGEILDPDVFG